MSKRIGVGHKVVAALISISSALTVNAMESVKPQLVLGYKGQDVEFNNHFAVEQRLMPVGSGELVLVGMALDDAGYSLALERISNIAKGLKRDVRLIVKHLEHEEDRNSIYFYQVPSWDKNVKETLVSNDYVYVPESNTYLTSDERRFYTSNIQKKTIVPHGDSLLQQVESVLLSFGWSLSYEEEVGASLEAELPALEVVLLSEEATSTEVYRLMDFLVVEFLESYNYKVLASEKTVVLKKK